MKIQKKMWGGSVRVGWGGRKFGLGGGGGGGGGVRVDMNGELKFL